MDLKGDRKRHDSRLATAPPALGKKYVDEDDENQVRGNWSGKLDFILSCLSYAVGLGNVWRFPYQCYKNGGGAFLLPFIIMLFVTGFPLFFLESAFGQYASSGVVSIWKASPIFQGVGFAMFCVSFFVSIYYNMIIAWTFFYLFSSFQSPLPWATCGNAWNTENCHVRGDPLTLNCTSVNGTWYNGTCYTAIMHGESEYQLITDLVNATTANLTRKSPSNEYFHNYVLDISSGFHDMGSLRWQLVLCLLLAWSTVCLIMIKGIKSSGRAVYFTATFPYLVLGILLVRGLTLPGAWDGIIYYITPRWSKLLSARVWCDAAVQVFFSLAPGWGGLITLSSYNKFKNNCLRDTYIVCIGDAVTSIFAGLVIFAIIGYMAEDLGVGIEDVADEGAGLAFIVYPEVVTRLPAAPLWAILFFLMLITLGLGTQFAIVNTVHTTIMDLFPAFFHVGRRRSYLMIALCGLCFLLGLSLCSQGGMFMLQLMDSYSATYSVLIIALVECVALAWVYGSDQLVADIKLMIGVRISHYWTFCWRFVSPVFLIAIMLFIIIDFSPNTYRGYVFPSWAEAMGWMISITSIICIPAVAAFKVITFPDKKVSIMQRVSILSKPTEDWGPACFRDPMFGNSPSGFDIEMKDNLSDDGDAALPLTSKQLEIEADIA